MIREIETADVPALFEVRTRTRENRLTRQELAALGIDERSIRLGLLSSLKGWLYEDDAVKGFAMGDKSNGEVTVIALLPEIENRGIGRRLLSAVETWLAETGWQEIWLITDTDISLRAYGFYRHLGWQDAKIENGNRHMSKTLAACDQR